MASRDVESTGQERDELDEIFDFNENSDDAIFAPIDTTIRVPEPLHTSPKRKAVDLGLDEEVQVSKKRKPIAKLDEDRFVEIVYQISN
jgi:replication fork protection complex subunit Csm3/Swi3